MSLRESVQSAPVLVWLVSGMVLFVSQLLVLVVSVCAGLVQNTLNPPFSQFFLFIQYNTSDRSPWPRVASPGRSQQQYLLGRMCFCLLGLESTQSAPIPYLLPYSHLPVIFRCGDVHPKPGWGIASLNLMKQSPCGRIGLRMC